MLSNNNIIGQQHEHDYNLVVVTVGHVFRITRISSNNDAFSILHFDGRKNPV